jgi:hypothetical protein
MALSTFVVGAVSVSFGWLDHGPQYGKRNNTDIYSGRILLNAAADVVALAGLFREIAVEPIDSSSGTGFVVDYNGTADPSGVFTQSDGTNLTAVLSGFSRTVWNVEDHHELQVEFTRVA